MHYQEKMDKLFGKGTTWTHRTLRTLFDAYSSEYSDTTMQRKLEILQTIINDHIDLEQLVSQYKAFYTNEKKMHVVKAADEGLEILMKQRKQL